MADHLEDDRLEEAEDVPSEDEASDESAEVSGAGRIVATVGPLRDGAYEKVR